MGLLILLCKTNKRRTRGRWNFKVSFKINQFISNFFNTKSDNQIVDADGISYFLKSNDIFNDTLRWEKINYGYEKMLAKYGTSSEKAIQKALVEMRVNIEMELQRSSVVPNDKNRIWLFKII